MGSYIHVGLVARVSAEWKERAGSTPSDDERTTWLREQRIEPALFDVVADEHTAVWTLKSDWLGAPLVSFLQEQDRVVQLHDSYFEERQQLYGRLLTMSSWDEVITLADKNEYMEFHLWTEPGIRSRCWEVAPVESEFTLIVYLAEGKAFLECWDRLFRYVEHMIGLQADRFPIARAVKLAIG